MLPKDLFEKVRRIEITTNRLVTDIFAGQYHSVFKGRGMEFDEVREYQPGDDIRTIDWNVTARTGRAHVKKYVEERELTVMIMVDASASNHFASVTEFKSKLAANIAAVLAFAAIRNNDKVGLIIFTNEVEKFIPPRKGLSHVLRIIREALYFSPKNRLTHIPSALEFLNRVTTRRSIVFLISDFLENTNDTKDNLKKALSIANKRHDIVAVTLTDPREIELPDCGLMQLGDLETGEDVLIDSSNKNTRETYYRNALARITKRNRLFDSVSVDHIDVSTHLAFMDSIVKFFIKRKKRQR